MSATTTTMTVIDNDHASLWFHPRKKIVHHQFHQFVHGQYFREPLEKGAELFEKYGAKKWLSDDRGNGALSKEDSDWALGVWQPRVMKAGWKFWAIVMPEKVIGQMNMRQWAKTYSENGIEVQIFSDPDEAMAWLESQ